MSSSTVTVLAILKALEQIALFYPVLIKAIEEDRDPTEEEFAAIDDLILSARARLVSASIPRG